MEINFHPLELHPLIILKLIEQYLLKLLKITEYLFLKNEKNFIAEKLHSSIILTTVEPLKIIKYSPLPPLSKKKRKKGMQKLTSRWVCEHPKMQRPRCARFYSSWGPDAVAPAASRTRHPLWSYPAHCWPTVWAQGQRKPRNEKVRVYRQRLIRWAINRATGRRSIKRVRIIYFE